MKKILLINGSPRHQKSTSGYLLQHINDKLKNENEIITCHTVDRTAIAEQVILENIHNIDIMVLAFPLYVDGIPGSLLDILCRTEKQIRDKNPDCKLYILVNNGFYDARQNAIAIDITWKWAEKAGLKRGSAIGIGAGEMVKMAPIGHGPSHNLGIAIEQFISDICEQKSRDTIFVEPNFPRILYKAAAHAGWRAQVRKNGLKVSDIRRKVIPEINR